MPSQPPPGRQHQPLFPIEEVKRVFQLSDETPSGLAWRISDGWRKAGSPAGKKYKSDKFWRVSIWNERPYCHRLVYQLRYGSIPDNADVVHAADNTEFDNRQELYLLTETEFPKEVSHKTASKRISVRKARRKPFLDLEDWTDQALEEKNLYRGFVCPHNHTIRYKIDHVCVACEEKILNNICGFDVSYVNQEYRKYYQQLLNAVDIKGYKDHWHYKFKNKRLNFPSYRSNYSKSFSDNVSISKAMYQLAWGDVGRKNVLRICDDPNCINPLHLKTDINRFAYPASVHPMECKIDYSKILQSFYVPLTDLTHANYRQTIEHPLEVPEDLPDYHED